MTHTTTTIAENEYLRFVQRDDWSWVERKNVNGIVCIVSCTNEGNVLLVEQYRPPVDCRVIEFPAGLSGDFADQPDEALEKAAQRELLEETGYRAQRMMRKTAVTSSAGLTNEVVTMFIAEGLDKVGEGGGDESEDIQIHEVPLHDVDNWPDRAQVAGKLVDGRVYAGLYFLQQKASNGDTSHGPGIAEE